jgi:hypothetical protein
VSPSRRIIEAPVWLNNADLLGALAKHLIKHTVLQTKSAIPHKDERPVEVRIGDTRYTATVLGALTDGDFLSDVFLEINVRGQQEIIFLHAERKHSVDPDAPFIPKRKYVISTTFMSTAQILKAL